MAKAPVPAAESSSPPAEEKRQPEDKIIQQECATRYTTAIEQIASAVKALNQAGLPGTEAGRIAFTCWQNCNGCD